MNQSLLACRVLPQLGGGHFLMVITGATWLVIILPLLGFQAFGTHDF